jgi:hypothetical protein
MPFFFRARLGPFGYSTTHKKRRKRKKTVPKLVSSAPEYAVYLTPQDYAVLHKMGYNAKWLRSLPSAQQAEVCELITDYLKATAKP